MITIVDYGMGNLGSIQNMLKRIGAACEVSGDPARVARAKKILLPGVGAFDNAMERIESAGLREVLDDKALKERVPVLGICLGMQLLTRGSEEGQRPGLGWIRAAAKKFPGGPGLKVPHMGWNSVRECRPNALTRDLPANPRFYFVHSYCVQVENPEDAILESKHGIGFAAAVQRGNVYGAQFHPEKSHKYGMKLLANFEALPC